MQQNVGIIDRAIRVLAAVVIAVLYFRGDISGTAAIVLGVIAVIFALTGMFGTCPAYAPLGISTRKSPH